MSEISLIRASFNKLCMECQRNFESNFMYCLQIQRNDLCTAAQQVHFLTGFQATNLIFFNLYTQKFINFTKPEVHICFAVLILRAEFPDDSGCIMSLSWIDQY